MLRCPLVRHGAFKTALQEDIQQARQGHSHVEAGVWPLLLLASLGVLHRLQAGSHQGDPIRLAVDDKVACK